MNSQQVMKSVLVSLCFFALVACGSSKTQPKDIQVAPAKTTPPLPSDSGSSDAGNGAGNAEGNNVPSTPPFGVPDDGGVGGAPEGNAQVPAPSGPSTGGNSGDNSQAPAQPPTVINPGQAGQAGQQGQAGNHQKEDSQQLSELQQRRNASKLFSGAADDILRAVLEARMESVKDENLALRNIRMAQSITDARLKLDQSTGDILVLVKMKGADNKETDTLLAGSLAEGADGFKVSDLSAIQANGVVSGKIVCMDADPTQCSTSHVRLEVGEVGRRAIVNIIFRNTNLKITGSFPESVRTIREMEDFYSLIKNTELKRTCDNSLQAGKIETAEVIQGKSIYKVFLKSYGNELIMMAGELRRSQNGGLNLQASREISDSDLVNMEQNIQYRTRIHETLRNLRLVENSGMGGLVFMADFTARVGAQQNGQKSTVQIRIDRKQTELRRLFNL